MDQANFTKKELMSLEGGKMKKILLLMVTMMMCLTGLCAFSNQEYQNLSSLVNQNSILSNSFKTSQPLTAIPIYRTINYQWENNTWVEKDKMDLSYQNNQITSVCYYKKDNNNWVLKYQANLEYDINGCCSQQTVMTPSEQFPGTLVPALQKKVCYCLYTSIPSSIVTYKNLWDDPIPNWFPFINNNFTYEDGHLNKHFNSIIDMEDYTETYHRTSLGYDENGRPLNILNEVSPDSLNWTNLERKTLSYLNNDTSGYSTFQENYMKDLYYELNTVCYPIKYSNILFKNWENNQWVINRKAEFQYNDQILPTIIEFKDINGETETNNSRRLNTFNNSSYVSESIMQVWNSDTWINSEKTENIYISTSNEDISYKPGFEVRNFPNPFKTSTCIEINSENNHPNTVKIFNIKGQIVKSFEPQKRQKLNWDAKDNQGNLVSSGIYFLRVETDGKVQSKPMLILK